jgi:hypothetical protein
MRAAFASRVTRSASDCAAARWFALTARDSAGCCRSAKARCSCRVTAIARASSAICTASRSRGRHAVETSLHITTQVTCWCAIIHASIICTDGKAIFARATANNLQTSLFVRWPIRVTISTIRTACIVPSQRVQFQCSTRTVFLWPNIPNTGATAWHRVVACDTGSGREAAVDTIPGDAAT